MMLRSGRGALRHAPYHFQAYLSVIVGAGADFCFKVSFKALSA
jgi:hypothetical protein